MTKPCSPERGESREPVGKIPEQMRSPGQVEVASSVRDEEARNRDTGVPETSPQVLKEVFVSPPNVGVPYVSIPPSQNVVPPSVSNVVSNLVSPSKQGLPADMEVDLPNGRVGTVVQREASGDREGPGNPEVGRNEGVEEHDNVLVDGQVGDGGDPGWAWSDCPPGSEGSI